MNKPFQHLETDTSKIFDMYSRSMKMNEQNKDIIIQTIDEFSTNIEKLQELKYIINDAILRHQKLSDFYKIKRDLQKCIQDLNDINEYIDIKIEQVLDENFYLLK
jgi:hemoglobin-like flavoprotein